MNAYTHPRRAYGMGLGLAISALSAASAVVLEGGLSVLRTDQQFDDETTIVLPEMQVQLQLPRRRSPYVGVGMGLAFDLRDEAVGGTEVDVTFSGAAGVRYDLSETFGLGAELRVRGHETGFVGSTADLTGERERAALTPC